MMFSFSDLSLFVISCDHVLTGDTTLHFLIISGLSDSSKATDQYHPVQWKVNCIRMLLSIVTGVEQWTIQITLSGLFMDVNSGK